MELKRDCEKLIEKANAIQTMEVNEKTEEINEHSEAMTM